MKNRLKELRQQRQWSQADLARALGVSRQAVNGFESGKFTPSLEMAFRLAALFDVAIEDIFINEVEHSMQFVIDKIKSFLGFEAGGERFTDQAIRAIALARSEAVRTNQTQVEPEHLLVGLLADPATESARLLRASGANRVVDIEELSAEAPGQLKCSPQSQFILELALQIVRLQRKRSIDTEHLLWGLMRLHETDASALTEAFQNVGIDPITLNRQVGMKNQ